MMSDCRGRQATRLLERRGRGREHEQRAALEGSAQRATGGAGASGSGQRAAGSRQQGAGSARAAAPPGRPLALFSPPGGPQSPQPRAAPPPGPLARGTASLRPGSRAAGQAGWAAGANDRGCARTPVGARASPAQLADAGATGTCEAAHCPARPRQCIPAPRAAPAADVTAALAHDAMSRFPSRWRRRAANLQRRPGHGRLRRPRRRATTTGPPPPAPPATTATPPPRRRVVTGSASRLASPVGPPHAPSRPRAPRETAGRPPWPASPSLRAAHRHAGPRRCLPAERSFPGNANRRARPRWPRSPRPAPPRRPCLAGRRRRLWLPVRVV